MRSKLKPLFWVGAAKKELMALPEKVQDVFGYALHLAQAGAKHDDVKQLKGLGGVLEVVKYLKGDTYRAVYTAKFGNAVYVLYCFQKKSKKGMKTPKPDMDIIRARLKAAKAYIEGENND